MAVTRRTTLLATTALALTGVACMTSAPPARAKGEGRRTIAFDDGWRFEKTDADQAQDPAFDDSAWRYVELPHDWSIEDAPGAPKTTGAWAPPSANWSVSRIPTSSGRPNPDRRADYPDSPSPDGPPLRVGPFDPKSSAAGSGSGWVVGGVGWYRKHFVGPDLARGDRAELVVDGSFRETDVWLNGVKIGSNAYGYGGFALDLTPHLRPGATNVLAVRVTNAGETTRWYSGSGLNQHVWLNLTGPVRAAAWGVAISTPRVSAERADVEIDVDIECHLAAASPIEVVAKIKDAVGTVVAQARVQVVLEGNGRTTARLAMQIENPRLWHPDTPHLYASEVTLLSDGNLTDRVATRFGARTIAVSAELGLTINGQPVKLKGACVHADHGILGSASIDAAEYRKVELLKNFGYNALRLGHHMFPPAFLDACDDLGILVVDELFDVWETPKILKNDYSKYFARNWRDDIAHFIRRDRNHPSVIFWSIGNEIPERAMPRGVEIAATLREAILALDRSRPITAGVNGPTGKAGEPARRNLDVVGYNYAHGAFEADHAANPDLVFMSTEQYARAIHDGWQVAKAHSYVLGEFVWTGMDYLGEVGAGSSILRPISEQGKPANPILYTIFLWDYPAFQGGCGEVDILGRRKPQGLYRDVLWGRNPLELLVQRPTPDGTFERLSAWGWPDELQSWTWSDAPSRPMTIRAYTTGDEVRLLLNGREVGRKGVTAADKLTASFEAPYEPGELLAIAFQNGEEIARARLETVGPPAHLRLRAERSRIAASPNDLAYVFAEVCDDKGRKVPDAVVELTFDFVGAGRLRATGSANPRGLKSFTDPRSRTFHGEALAIVQGAAESGRAILKVSSPGLRGDTIELRVG
jgi:beta-galactosidase